MPITRRSQHANARQLRSALRPTLIPGLTSLPRSKHTSTRPRIHIGRKFRQPQQADQLSKQSILDESNLSSSNGATVH